MKIIQIIPAPVGAHMLCVTMKNGKVECSSIDPVSCLALIEEVQECETLRYPYPLGFGDFLTDLPSIQEDVTLHPSKEAAEVYFESFASPSRA